jgi:tRNA(fMet)-specific endonuclease VapC
MISHLLDTDMLTLFQHGHPKVSARCAVAPPGSLAITIISVEEQFLGWYTRARRAKRDDEIASAYDRMTEFVGFIKQLPIVSFTAKAIQDHSFPQRGSHNSKRLPSGSVAQPKRPYS